MRAGGLARGAGLLAAALAAAAPAPVAAQAVPPACQATPEVLAETTLADLSDRWFGSVADRFAILLATNLRAADPGFAFVADPLRLPVGTKAAPNRVCIPGPAEAERLRRRYATYLGAVADMALAEPSEVVHSLDPLPASGPVRVVTWVRADQLARFPAPGQAFTVASDLWVTESPHLQRFCQAFAAGHSADPEALTLRLEQRLGLPPASAKTHVVELEIADAGSGALFRPCATPETTTTTCPTGGPAACAAGDAACSAHRAFFLGQYYSSYGLQRPVEVPWTSLGYTFDWAPGDPGLGGAVGFRQLGESEYVLRQGATATVAARSPTATFCAPAR